MSHIQYRGEDKLVNEFKQMQVEMRAMIQGNKSPEKVPIKLKQHALVTDMGLPMHQKNFFLEDSSSARIINDNGYASPKPLKAPSFVQPLPTQNVFSSTGAPATEKKLPSAMQHYNDGSNSLTNKLLQGHNSISPMSNVNIGTTVF